MAGKSDKKTQQGESRGRPQKESKPVTVRLSADELELLEKFREYSRENLHKPMQNPEAIRFLMDFALRHWMRKYENPEKWKNTPDTTLF